MSDIGSNRALKQVDQSFLNEIAKMSYGSGISEKSNGGAGYVGAFATKDGKIRLVKMLTKSGERSSVAKAGGLFNHLGKANEGTAKEQLWTGSGALLNRLLDVAKTAGVWGEVVDLLEADLKGDKTLSAAERNIGCPALLSRKFLAKAVTTIVGAAKLDVKTFWNQIKPHAKALSSSGKTTTYEEAVRNKGNQDLPAVDSVESVRSDEELQRLLNLNMPKGGQGEIPGEPDEEESLLKAYPLTKDEGVRAKIVAKLTTSANKGVLQRFLELTSKDKEEDLEVRTCIFKSLLKTCKTEEELLELLGKTDGKQVEVRGMIYDRLMSRLNELEKWLSIVEDKTPPVFGGDKDYSDVKNCLPELEDKDNEEIERIVAEKQAEYDKLIGLYRGNANFMTVHNLKCVDRLSKLDFDENWMNAIGVLFDDLGSMGLAFNDDGRNSVIEQTSADFSGGRFSGLLGLILTSLKSKESSDSPLAGRLAPVRDVVFTSVAKRVLKLNLERLLIGAVKKNNQGRVESFEYNMPLTRAGKLRLLASAVNSTILAMRCLVSSVGESAFKQVQSVEESEERLDLLAKETYATFSHHVRDDHGSFTEKNAKLFRRYALDESHYFQVNDMHDNKALGKNNYDTLPLDHEDKLNFVSILQNDFPARKELSERMAACKDQMDSILAGKQSMVDGNKYIAPGNQNPYIVLS